MNRYRKGANVERQAVTDHIKNGAIFAMRGAGSKCKGKLKVDVIALYDGFLFLEQYKKSKTSFKKEKKQFFKVKLPKKLVIVRRFIHNGKITQKGLY